MLPYIVLFYAFPNQPPIIFQFDMAQTNPFSNERPSPIAHLALIFRIQEIFGLHPYEVRPITGSLSFNVITLPLGLTLYLAHGVLFVYCLISYYQLDSLHGSIYNSTMAMVEEMVTDHILFVSYISSFIGMTLNRRLLKKVSSLLALLNEHFERIGIGLKVVRLTSLKKFLMIFYCFGNLLMFGYYWCFLSPSGSDLMYEYSLYVVPSMSITCSIWSYMMYVGQLKAFQDVLNDALIRVARTEMDGPVKRVWALN